MSILLKSMAELFTNGKECLHLFNAWSSVNAWLDIPIIEDYFGPSTSLNELVQKGELLQCEGYKCIYEEARRQKPRCSMALNWCYNEPWPTAAGNSLINWPAEVKPSYYAVAQSCRPMLASARIPKFTWMEGEMFDPELWILNDSYDHIPRGQLTVLLETSEGLEEIFVWKYSQVNANTNLPGPTIRYKLPKMNTARMKLILQVDKYPLMNSEYVLLYSQKEKADWIGYSDVIHEGLFL